MHPTRTAQGHAAAVSGLVALALACGGERATPRVEPPAEPARSEVPAEPPVAEPEPGAERDTDFVDVGATVPGVVLDIRYATANNFTREVVYPAARCLLRRPVAKALGLVQRDLAARGLGLLIWDCYRPISIQQQFWRLVPDERYVARPVLEDGQWIAGSKHNRGAAVDLALVDGDGAPLPMPTDYDDFSERAHRDYAGGTAESRANAALLEQAMRAHGFEPLASEWWHFDGPGWQAYALADEPLQ